MNTITMRQEIAYMFIDKEEYDNFKANELLKKGSIIPNLLEQLFSDASYYEGVKALQDGKASALHIVHLPEEKTNLLDGYTLKIFARSKLVKEMDIAMKEGLVNLNEEAQARFLNYCNQIDFTNSDLMDEKIKQMIEGKEYEFSVKSFLDVLLMEEKEYETFFEVEKEPCIKGISKVYFLYALKEYFVWSNILNMYLFPQKVIDRLREIRLYERLDFQTVGTLHDSHDPIVEKVHINKKLESAVLQDMKDEWNPLQKAIFIYIKLCKLLTYDEVYYSYGQQGKGAEKHQNIYQIADITPVNNACVCYEFNAIYEKFLYDLKIPFQTIYYGSSEYGDGHNHIELVYQKFLLDADSTESNDLIHAKRNEPLEGLKCKNINKNTKQEFQSMVDEIYEYIIQKEIEHGCSQSPYAFQDIPIALQEEMLHEEFKKIVGKQKLSLEDRVKCFLLKVQENNIDGFDGFKYILLLKKLLFGSMTTSYVIFTNNQNEAHPLHAIFVFNPSGIDDDGKENQYYYFPRPNQVLPITKEEIEQHFDDEEWDYIVDMEKRIPGIHPYFYRI